jgi:spermidine/putrescine transport system substrate-binding protein
MRRKGRGAGREISRRELIAGGVSALSAISAPFRLPAEGRRSADLGRGPPRARPRHLQLVGLRRRDHHRRFRARTGVRVTYDTYESNEDLIAKLQAGATGYDIVVPSGYAVACFARLDLIQPIDRSALTEHWANLDSRFLGTPVDPENQFTVPWQWGSAGLAVRTDLVKESLDSWGVFQDPRLRGKMTQLDDMRDVIGAWLKFRGHSLNSTSTAELEQARADAIQAKPNLKSYVSAPVKAQLIAGDVWVAHLWNGDTAQARAVNPAIEFILPKEGSMIYLDSLCIPRGARSPRAAHAFMNFVLRADQAASISRRTGYGSPNAAALAADASLLRPPTPEEMTRLEYQDDLGAATTEWDRIWTEIKAA